MNHPGELRCESGGLGGKRCRQGRSVGEILGNEMEHDAFKELKQAQHGQKIQACWLG